MKKRLFLVVLLAVFSLILIEQNASAQSGSGISTYSTVDYDANSNSVSGYSYTYGTYDNAGYYTTQVTSFLYDSDMNMLSSGTASGNSLEAYLPLSATGTGCDEYQIASFHHVTAQYYVTYYFYYGNYVDGYYDPFNYLGFAEQEQSLPFPPTFFAPVDSSVRVLN